MYYLIVLLYDFKNKTQNFLKERPKKPDMKEKIKLHPESSIYYPVSKRSIT